MYVFNLIQDNQKEFFFELIWKESNKHERSFK